MRPVIAGCLLLLCLVARSATAAELELPYPNDQDDSLQEAVTRTCAAAADGDRVTIRIAPGTYAEQVSTTVACKKSVSWHFAGSGVGMTRLVARDPVTNVPLVSQYPDVTGVVRTSNTLFTGLISCGRSNPWANPLTGQNVCAATFRETADPNTNQKGPPTWFQEFCLAGAMAVPFEPFGTTCEVSDMSLDGAGPPGGNGISAAWTRLIVRNVSVENFAGGQAGCQNCREARLEHVQARCRTPTSGAGIAIAANGATWPAAESNISSGNQIHHVDVQGCGVGIIAVRQGLGSFSYNTVADSAVGVQLVGAGDMTVSHNRLAGNGTAILLQNTRSSTFSFNRLAANGTGFWFGANVPPAAVWFGASDGNDFEHNLDFGNGKLFEGSAGSTVEHTVSPEGDPAGW